MEEVLKAIPQRAPFLFVDKIIEKKDRWIHCQKKVTGDEDFFKGHFPGNPIMPGVLLQECLFQTAAILISGEVENGLGVVTKVENARFRRFVTPGDVLNMQVDLHDIVGNAYYMKGKILVNNKIVMAASFTCAMV